MARKSTTAAASKTTSVSASTTLANANSSSKSSLLKSCFAPSSLQLHLFASVIQSFESQQLRIHDTITGRLRQQHPVRSGTTICCLDWGHYGKNQRENRSVGSKKRKRPQIRSEDVVVAYGTSASEICMYSPAEGRIVGTLSGNNEGGIRDFKFSIDNEFEAWSIGGDGKLVQWDLSSDQVKRTISLSDSAVSVLSTPSSLEPRLFCASSTPFSIYTTEESPPESYNSFKGQVRCLKRSGTPSQGASEALLAVDNDRYISIFDVKERNLIRTLVSGSEVEDVDLFSPNSDSTDPLQEQLLAVVTKEGIVELFSHPFKSHPVTNGDLKSKRRSMTRKADARVKLIDGSQRTSSISTALIQGPELIVVSVDGGVDPVFQKVRWQDEGTGELLFAGTKEIVKVKSISTLNSAQLNGVKDMGKTYVDESRAVVTNGAADSELQATAIEISSGGEEENDSDDVEAEDEDADEPAPGVLAVEVGQPHVESSVDMEDVQEHINGAAPDVPQDADMENAEAGEPSFGDLLAAKHPTTVTIADSFALERTAFNMQNQGSIPSGMSLGTVLTQALKTNDKSLLESCLHANDTGIIQNTIQRLDSALAANLLSKLAERLASRPGRYGHLLSWVQWTCIAHGGVIASQSDATAQIRTLYKVLNQRSQSLDKLLLLKGKLDMLDAQLALRKKMQTENNGLRAGQDEPGMIYIEGEAADWSSEEDADEVLEKTKKKTRKGTHRTRALKDLVDDDDLDMDEEDDEGMLMVNGTMSQDSDGAESDEGVNVNKRMKSSLYDVEADVSGDEVGPDEEDENSGAEDSDEEDIDDDDDDDGDEQDSSMDGFINDEEISYASDEDVDLDEPEPVRKPEKKRSKHR